MARGSILKGPNYVHPERASAVGSRNSLHRDGRNEYAEAKVIIDEEVDKILNHVSAKLPPEVLEKLHVGGTIKETLHNYFNQNYQNMYNRYMVTVEDEMGKKFRHLIDKEETEHLNKYTPREISFLMDSIGGADAFHTGPIETSVANIYGHLQGHVQKGFFSLEDNTRKLLSGKTNVGGFLRGKFANSVVSANFADNSLKPETVNDVSVVINVHESDLVKPIYHYQVASESIIKDVISEQILTLVDKEVDKINAELLDKKQEGLNESQRIFEKINKLGDHIGFEELSDNSPQFSLMAKKFLDAIKGIEAEIDHSEYDPLDTRENVLKILDDENIRNRGFNHAVNVLLGILDISHLGYQHIENFKNCRRTIIREYEDAIEGELPDEHYSLTLEYLDDLQLRELRTAFCQQIEEFESEAAKLFKVFNIIHANEKQERGFLDFEDVSNEVLGAISPKQSTPEEPEAPEIEKRWDEITFIQPDKNDLEKLNDTFAAQKRHLKTRYQILRNKIRDLYENDNPSERVIVEQRLDFLMEETEKYLNRYNPFQVSPGLFLEVNISSIKRRESTINSMGNVVTQFLNEIAQDVPDFSFDEYHRKKTALEDEGDQFTSAV